MKIRIATRKSALALWQAEHVAERLGGLPEVESVELRPMSTRGDEVLDRSLQQIGGKGLFIKELEVAMAEDRADIAVHSMKDLPAELPAGFALAAILARANPADALVGRRGMRLEALDPGARIGSSSLRRQAQLRRLRPDLVVTPLRGNVNSRLDKLDGGDFDAIVLAAAGLERLELGARISQEFSPEEMLPAAAQGVLGLECRADDEAMIDLLARLTCPVSEQTTMAERAVAARFGASCQSPFAAYAQVSGDEMTITALVATPDGKEHLRKSLCGPAERAADLGRDLAERMLGHGAREILDRAEKFAPGKTHA